MDVLLCMCDCGTSVLGLHKTLKGFSQFAASWSDLFSLIKNCREKCCLSLVLYSVHTGTWEVEQLKLNYYFLFRSKDLKLNHLVVYWEYKQCIKHFE